MNSDQIQETAQQIKDLNAKALKLTLKLENEIEVNELISEEHVNAFLTHIDRAIRAEQDTNRAINQVMIIARN